MIYWYWMILGLALMATEFILPTFVMFWFGLSALVVAVMVKLVPEIGLGVQLAVFIALALGSAFFWRLKARHFFSSAEEPLKPSETEGSPKTRDPRRGN